MTIDSIKAAIESIRDRLDNDLMHSDTPMPVEDWNRLSNELAALRRMEPSSDVDDDIQATLVMMAEGE